MTDNEPAILRVEMRDGRYRFLWSRNGVADPLVTRWIDVPIQWDHFLTGELDVGVAASNSTTATHVARFFSLELKPPALAK